MKWKTKKVSEGIVIVAIILTGIGIVLNKWNKPTKEEIYYSKIDEIYKALYGGHENLYGDSSGLIDKIDEINEDLHGEDGLVDKIDEIREALNGEDGLINKIDKIETNVEILTEDKLEVYER